MAEKCLGAHAWLHSHLLQALNAEHLTVSLWSRRHLSGSAASLVMLHQRRHLETARLVEFALAATCSIQSTQRTKEDTFRLAHV